MKLSYKLFPRNLGRLSLAHVTNRHRNQRTALNISSFYVFNPIVPFRYILLDCVYLWQSCAMLISKAVLMREQRNWTDLSTKFWHRTDGINRFLLWYLLTE